MARSIDFEIIDHGCDGEQYFPGCGVAFSRFTDCVTGIGYSAREAGADALEQIYCGYVPVPGVEDIGKEVAALSDAPSFDPEDPEISPEWHHYVSIRWRVID